MANRPIARSFPATRELPVVDGVFADHGIRNGIEVRRVHGNALPSLGRGPRSLERRAKLLDRRGLGGGGGAGHRDDDDR
jgi:hypothetical protein